jgi:hypothetical protein
MGMKKIDYYAVQQPWKMPKWLGVTLGGIFGVIALGSAVTAYELTKPVPKAPEVAAVAAPEAPAPTVTTPAATVMAKASVASNDSPAPARHASKHAKKASKRASKAIAKRGLTPAKSAAILAKHDSKEKRRAKDNLDKLLGL